MDLSTRRILLRAFLVISLVLVVLRLAGRAVPVLTDDFMAYWSAARLLARGADPYDPLALLSVQKSAGWPHAMPLPTWYGPWIVAATVPVGMLPYWPARVGWMILQIGCLLTSAALLWRVYDGSAGSRRPFTLATTFAPSILCIVEGQITPLILIGFVGFIVSMQRQRYWLAGAALFPLTAKPLTLYLIWLALVVWTIRSRRTGVLGGLILTVAGGSVAAFALNTAVFVQWLRFAATYSPLVQPYTPTPGSVLRYVFGTDRVWLAYPSVVIGLLWWITNWWRHRDAALAWREHLPMLLSVSLLTAPFAWSTDALLLFPGVVQRATRGWARIDMGFWTLLNGLALGLYPILRYRQTWYLSSRQRSFSGRDRDCRVLVPYVLTLKSWYPGRHADHVRSFVLRCGRLR